MKLLYYLCSYVAILFIYDSYVATYVFIKANSYALYAKEFNI